MARIFFFLLVVVAVVVVDTHKSAPPVLPFHGNPAFDLTFRRLKGSITIMMKTYARFLQHSETPAPVPSICVYTRKKYVSNSCRFVHLRIYLRLFNTANRHGGSIESDPTTNA